MSGLWSGLNVSVEIVDLIVRLAVPLAAFAVAVRFEHRRKSPMWQGLALFFALSFVAAAWGAVLEWTALADLERLIASGASNAERSGAFMNRQIPLILLQLMAGLSLIWMLMRLGKQAHGRFFIR